MVILTQTPKYIFITGTERTHVGANQAAFSFLILSLETARASTHCSAHTLQYRLPTKHIQKASHPVLDALSWRILLGHREGGVLQHPRAETLV